MTVDRWDALSPHELRGLMEGFAAPWWVAGGWALDLFLGGQTRQHGDIDIAILRGDQLALREHLAGWDVHVAHKGELTPWAPGDWLMAPRHQFWARRSPEEAWSLEILLEDREGDDWLFRKQPSLRMPLRAVGGATADGIRYMSPEVVLLYKANAPELARNAADFDVGAPALHAAARSWLRASISVVYPGHSWLGRLA